jgi:Glycosyl transferases group 1
MTSAIQTIVLTVDYDTRSSYYLDWLDAFRTAPQFAITAFNLFHRGERRFARAAIETAELIVALHTCTADTLEFIRPMAGALQARRGRFVVFVGNEYNSPWVRLSEKRQFIADVGADIVGTQLLQEAGEWLYDGTRARVVSLPHALNNSVFRREKDVADRGIDIGSRSARYPIFLGDKDRNQLTETFRELATFAGLAVDIDASGRLRLARAEWAAFLNDCRGTISSEAGSWFLEREDHTVLEIREFLRQRSRGRVIRADSLAHALSRRLPYGAKEKLRSTLKWLPIRHEAMDFSDAEFAEVQARFFEGRPHAPVYTKCVSSRHFDAAGTGTCQLLIRGRYNDVLVADEHYIPIDPDLGNSRDALARFLDAAERNRVANNAYSYVHDTQTYRHRVETLYRAL